VSFHEWAYAFEEGGIKDHVAVHPEHATISRKPKGLEE
jgi:hypothetical protein